MNGFETQSIPTIVRTCVLSLSNPLNSHLNRIFKLFRRNFRVESGLFDIKSLKLTVKQRQMFRNKGIQKFSF